MTDIGNNNCPQREAILDLLWDQEWHSYMDIAEVGGNAYVARINELKQLHYSIENAGGKAYRLTSKKIVEGS